MKWLLALLPLLCSCTWPVGYAIGLSAGSSGYDEVDYLEGAASEAAPLASHGWTKEDDLFLMPDVVPVDADVPARFLAPVPNRLEFANPWSEHAPPMTLFRHRLCNDLGGARAEWEAAVVHAIEAGDDAAAVGVAYGSIPKWCDADAHCSWLASIVDGPARPAALTGLSDCPTAVAGAAFEGDVPPAALVSYLDSWVQPRPAGWHPDLPAAAMALLETDNAWMTRRAAFLIGQEDSARAAEALLTLHGAVEPNVRDVVAASMHQQSDPRAKALYEAMCADVERSDAICDGIWPARGLPEPSDAGKESCAAMRDTTDPEELGDWAIVECLRGRARRSWDLARADAAVIRTLDAGTAGEDVLSVLRKYETRDALEAELRSVGLLWREGDEALRTDGTPSVTVQDFLERGGVSHWFDTETGMYPNHHDDLLLTLASLAGPPLSDVLFHEIAPPLNEQQDLEIAGQMFVTSKGPPKPYRLQAFHSGVLWEVEGQDYGDWYDVEAVLGLLSLVARDLGAPHRALMQPTGDQTAIVVVAPKDAIVKGLEAGLLRKEEALAPLRLGQDFEAEVLKALMNAEGEIDLDQLMKAP
jgi:hypothetical protein